MNRSARRRTLSILAATMLVGAIAAPAQAAVVGPLFEDAARSLPRVARPELRLPPVSLRSIEEARYGLTETSTIGQLDAAKSDELSAIDSAATDIARRAGSPAEKSKLSEALTDCGKEGLKKAAEDYRDAAVEGSGYPNFGDAYYYGAFGCLSSKFPSAPEEAVDAAASYLTSHSTEPARNAADTAPTAFANWLNATADDASSADGASYTPVYTPESPSDNGSSIPLVPLGIGVGLLAVGAFVAVRRRA